MSVRGKMELEGVAPPEGGSRMTETNVMFRDAEERAYFDRYGFVVRVEARGTLDDGTQFVRLAYGDPVKGVWKVQEFMHYEAFADAASFVSAMEEAATYTLEERLGPFGLEWAREQEERRGWGAH